MDGWTNIIKTPTTNTRMTYSTSNSRKKPLKILYGPTQTQNLIMNSVSSNHFEMSTLFPFNEEHTQAV